MRPLRFVVAFALWIGGCLASGLAPAQDVPEMITDRPDVTESAEVVPFKTVQIEAGLLHVEDDEGGVKSESDGIGGVLFRIGISEPVELRFGWGGYLSQTVRQGGGNVGSDGSDDLNLGVKINLGDEDGRKPSMALIVATTLPTGGDEVSTDRFDPAVVFAGSSTFTDRLSLGYNAGLVWSSAPASGGGTTTDLDVVYSTALGIGVGRKLGTFVEVFGTVPVDSGDSTVSLDGGVTYLLRPP